MTTDPGTHADRLVFYLSPMKMSLVLLGAIGFVVAGIWIGTSGPARGVAIWQVVIASYVGVPFFTACGLYAAYRLVRRRPALELDPMGITDAASGLAAGRMSWDEIDHFVLYKYQGQSMLGIIPKDLDSFMNRQNAFRRYLTKVNLGLGCAPINIPQVGLRMKLAELAELLQTRYGMRVERDGSLER